MKLIDISKLEGVADLPLLQRGQFAIALKREDEGKAELAAHALALACNNG